MLNTKKEKVFLVIPNNVFASDLLRTKYLSYLASKYSVLVFTPFIFEEFARVNNYPRLDGVEYIKRGIEDPKFWSFFKFLRITLLGEFDYLKSVKYFYKRPNFKHNKHRRLVRGIF